MAPEISSARKRDGKQVAPKVRRKLGMAKIGSMMDIGKRAMMNSQTALQTVSHNIANRTTEGYSRQRVDVVTAPPITEGNLQLGMGNRAASVSRTNNPYLEKQLQKENGQMGLYQSRSDAMGRVEQVFNEQINKGLNQYMTDFFNAFRELSNNPESVTSRTMVKEASVAVTKDFHRVDSQLTEIQKDLDQRTKNEVQEINKMVKEVATLNQQIAQTENQGIPANDQRDRRDVLLKHINEKIDINYAEGSNGMVTVSTAGNAILVSGLDSYQLETHDNPKTQRVDVFFRPGDHTPPFVVTDRIHSGELGGLLEVRDKVIPDFKNKMDHMASTFATEVNNIHTRGFDRKGRAGLEFFEVPPQVEGSAREIKLNEDIAADVNRVAAGAQPNAVGDNTVANVVSQLQYKEVMDGSTMDDYYNSQVGRVGVLAQRADKAKEAQGNILKQLDTIRESVSGVSLDEETTKMIEWQKSFEASARVIRTADEMFDTVLSLKRL
jgi:flagellar hook-associated protein 1 FlgK